MRKSSNVPDRETKLLNFLSTLNIIPCVLVLIWALFVIAVYANPRIPSIRWSAGFLGTDRWGIRIFFEPHDKFMLICTVLRIIAAVYVCFLLASLVIGFAAVKKKRCVRVWRVLCFINVFLCLISTNVFSAGVTAYIFAKLSNIKEPGKPKNGILCQ